MARRSKIDLHWDPMERGLLAWEAVRLNGEYRQDWQSNQAYLDWLKRYPEPWQREMIKGGTYVYAWIGKIAQKWNFSCRDRLPSPDLELPYRERHCFAMCFDSCCKDEDQPVNCRNPKTGEIENCLLRYRYLIRQCPFDLTDWGGVSRRWPGELLFSQRPEMAKRWDASKVGKFDNQARQAPDNLVLWANRSVSRQSLKEHILFYLGFEKSQREKAGKPTWDLPSRKLELVRTAKHPEFLVLSINMRGSEQKVRREIDDSLRVIPRYPSDKRKTDQLWEGLRLYRLIDVVGRKAEQVYKDLFGLQKWTAHQIARKEGDWNKTIRNAEYAYRMAKKFVEEWQWKRLIPSQNELISWEKLSPHKPPRLP